MTQNKTILAVFDFDGTLTSGHLWMGIAKHHWKKKVKRMALIGYITSHLPLLLLAKTKIYSQEKNRAKWGEDLIGLLKDFTIEETEAIFQWVTDEYFWPLMRQDVIARLNQHKQQGHKIVLLSGMFTPYLRIIGKKLKADYVIGTEMELKDRRYTGKIIQPLCFSDNKAKYLNRFIERQQFDIDLTASSAYADSFYDLPVLEMIGYPVATYPDRRLLELAKENGWESIG